MALDVLTISSMFDEPKCIFSDTELMIIDSHNQLFKHTINVVGSLKS